MKKTLVVIAAISVAALTHAGLVVVGELQDENGASSDWNPAEGLIMADSAPIYTYTANNLLDGTRYKYKVLDDLGAPPAEWGDPEIVNVDTMAYGDADGSVLITVDTSLVNGNGGAVTWVNTDGAPLHVVGDFMDEAGGAGDWNPSDPSFAMTPQGAGYYTIDLVISTAGWYEFKGTDGTGWDFQVGTDGFGNNAGAHYFETTTANEALTLFIDLDNQAIGVVPEPTSLALIMIGSFAAVIGRRLRK